LGGKLFSLLCCKCGAQHSTEQNGSVKVRPGHDGIYSLCDIIMGFESNQQAKEFIYFDDSFWEIYKATFLPALTDIENVKQGGQRADLGFLGSVDIGNNIQRRPVVIVTGVVGSYVGGG